MSDYPRRGTETVGVKIHRPNTNSVELEPSSLFRRFVRIRKFNVDTVKAVALSK